MKYVLKLDVLGEIPEIEITKKIFDSLKISKTKLDNAFDIEENYDIVIANYLEFEQDLFKFYLNDTVKISIISKIYEDFYLVGNTLERRLLNMLASVRRYLDQTNKILNLFDEKAVLYFEELRSTEFDTNFSYKFMESLRNYIAA